MWLIPKQIQSGSSVYAAAPPCLTKDSKLPCDSSECPHEWWVIMSGKPFPRACSWIGWRHRPWSQRLFSRATSQRSIGPLGLEKSTGSWAAFRASLSVRPGSDSGRTTSDGYGPRYGMPCAEWARGEWLSKTSQLSLFEGSPRSSVTLPKQGGLRNGVVYERQTLAHRISETDSSSSLSTPWVEGGELKVGEVWPTPASATHSSNIALGADGKRSGKVRPSLEALGTMWATPTGALGNKGMLSPAQAAKDAERRGVTNDLMTQVGSWPTPTARDHKGAIDPSKRDRTAGTLDKAAEWLFQRETWPTPTSVDARGSRRAGLTARPSTTLTDAAFSHRDPETVGRGRKLRPALNPLFVEWLMGWPSGWTSPEPTACGRAEMESWRSRLDMQLRSFWSA